MASPVITCGFGFTVSLIVTRGFVAGSGPPPVVGMWLGRSRSSGPIRERELTFMETVQLRLDESIATPIDRTVAVHPGKTHRRTLGLGRRLNG